MTRRTSHHAPIRATIRAHTPGYGPPPPEPLNVQGERAFFSPEHNAWLDNLYGWPAGSALGIYQANAALREDARRLIDAANMRSPPQYDAVVTPTRNGGDGSPQLDGNDPSPPPNYTRFEVAERRVNSAPRNRENLPFYRPDAPRGTRMYHPMCEGAVVSNGPGAAPRCQPLRELPGEIRYRRNVRSNGTQIPDDVPTGWRLPTGWRAHAAAVNLEIERERERRLGGGVNWLDQLGNPVYNPNNPVYNPDQLDNPVYNPADQAFLREEQIRWEARQARRRQIVAQEMERHGVAELPPEGGAEPRSGTPVTASMADVLRRQARQLEYYDPVTHLPRVSEYECLTGIAPFGRGNVQTSQNNISGNPPSATPQSAFAGASNQGTPRGGLFGRSPSVGQSGRRVTFAENIAEEPQPNIARRPSGINTPLHSLFDPQRNPPTTSNYFASGSPTRPPSSSDGDAEMPDGDLAAVAVVQAARDQVAGETSQEDSDEEDQEQSPRSGTMARTGLSDAPVGNVRITRRSVRLRGRGGSRGRASGRGRGR
ncbi:hypothetical protein TI39_contig896g00002 [Zymoseptoria brevis]|uniref:Uncharacterized protein n=1 Tax=Zymoseptoria brevis TaxID=1047168 RepID=A0A0F4GG15_9PEZI|nr:hypothetical protein TI39_contig896g00002 [Zymoseptoria brevis]